MRVKRHEKTQAGTVLIAFALLLMVLLGFVALSMEAGRWFVVRAELSKTVDAAALAAAKNISNPNVSPRTLAAEFCSENFAGGYLGTPASGTGSPSFNIQMIGGDKVQVDGRVSATAILARLFGVDLVPIVSSGVAQKRDVEIMMVLDRSGSMSGTPIADLKRAARSFVDFFTDTQAQDRMGLISFATSVTVNQPLGINYVTSMRTAIDAMTAVGATNAEDALDQADGPQGLTNQNGVPGDARVQQFLIFFSDGRPTAFRGTFKQRGTTYDAVGCATGNCGPSEIGSTTVTYNDLGYPDREQFFGLDPRVTGDGVHPQSRCGYGRVTTRWNVFDTRPVPGHGPDDCAIPWQTTLASHVCNLASSMALQHAQELKDARVTIYAIGLGPSVNRQFMEQVASSASLYYYAPTSDQLQAIFNKVAQEIKLRLVQ